MVSLVLKAKKAAEKFEKKSEKGIGDGGQCPVGFPLRPLSSDDWRAEIAAGKVLN